MNSLFPFIQFHSQMIRWDHKRDGYILSHETYNNNILYIQDNPTYPNTRKSHRMSIWFWNYRTHTRTHLPPLYQQMYGATIWKHYIYVVARKNLTYRFYYLNMSLKNPTWQQEDLLTKQMTSKDDFIPILYNGNEYGIIVMFEQHFRLFHPERRTTKFRYFDAFFIGEWDMINIVTIKDKLYCLREDRLYDYDIPTLQVLDRIRYDHLGMISRPENCKGTCMHVYDNRFIMIIFDNYMRRRNNDYITYWSIGYYDCKERCWCYDSSKKYERINEDPNPDFPDGLCHYLWEHNSLCYMCCRVTEKYGNVEYNREFEYNIERATTKQYHISYFLKNWYVIKNYILMRHLMEHERATLKDSSQNTIVGRLVSINETDVFMEVLQYLICFDKHKYCMD